MDETRKDGFRDFEAVYKRGRLRPKDRMLVTIANITRIETTGEGFLTLEQEQAVRDLWQPSNDKDLDEFNLWIKAWKAFCIAEIDSEATFLNIALEVKELVWRGLFISASLNYIRASDLIREIETSQKNRAAETNQETSQKEKYYLDLIRGLHSEMVKMIDAQLDLELTAEPAGIAKPGEGMKDLLSKDAFARKRARLVRECGKFLAFEDFYNRASKAFEQDLSAKYRKWKRICFGVNLATFNKIADEAFTNKEFHIFPDKIAPEMDRVNGFYDSMRDLLGKDF